MERGFYHKATAKALPPRVALHLLDGTSLSRRRSFRRRAWSGFGASLAKELIQLVTCVVNDGAQPLQPCGVAIRGQHRRAHQPRDLHRVVAQRPQLRSSLFKWAVTMMMPAPVMLPGTTWAETLPPLMELY